MISAYMTALLVNTLNQPFSPAEISAKQDIPLETLISSFGIAIFQNPKSEIDQIDYTTSQQALDRIMNVEVDVIVGLLFWVCFCLDTYPQIGRDNIRQMWNGAIDKFAGTETLRNSMHIEFDIRSP